MAGIPESELPGKRIGGERGALHVPAGTGPSYWLNGDTYTFKAISEQTLLTFSLIEASVPPAGGPPAHTHPIADEAFYLLSGQLEFTVEDEEIEVKAGDFVYVPHGLEHKFRNVGVPTAQMLYLFAPGGPEYALMAWGTPTEPGVPVPPPEPHKPNPMAGRWPDHPTKPEELRNPRA